MAGVRESTAAFLVTRFLRRCKAPSSYVLSTQMCGGNNISPSQAASGSLLVQAPLRFRGTGWGWWARGYSATLGCLQCRLVADMAMEREASSTVFDSVCMKHSLLVAVEPTEDVPFEFVPGGEGG